MKKNIIITLALATLLSGCGKDFLSEAPKLSQSDVLTLSTFDGRDKAVAGAYAPLASTSWYCGSFILSNEMKTMNGKRWAGLSQYNSGRYINDYAVNFTPTNTSSLWAYGYYVILSANSVINGLDAIEGEEQAKNNIKAEALFLRAFAHFDLVRTFAQPYGSSASSELGVPIVLTVDSEAKPARSTVKEVYDQIISDLTEAESIIDPSYVRSGVTDATASVNIYTIKAFLSRVYLYSQQWQKAADYATEVIKSGKYSMWTAAEVATVDSKGTLTSVYQEDVPKKGEVIFEVYENLSQSYGGGNENICGMASYTGYGDCGASQDLVDLYENGDVRKKLVSADEDGLGLFTMKYFGKGLSSIDANNTIVLRLSEMYLNRAEAIVNGASVSGVTAQSDLEVIASHRGATAQPATKTGVYTERAKELAWEGHLWFDLGRTGRAMTRKDVSGTQIPTQIDPGDYRWAMPIPDREFTVNPNLIQNDGYSK